MELETVLGFNGSVPSGVFLVDGGERVLAPLGRALAISSLSDPHDQAFLRGHTDNISACALSSSGSLLATGQKAEADVLVFELGPGGRASKRFRFEEHEGTVVALAFTEDERVLLSAATDGTIFAWDLASGAIIARARQAENPTLAIAAGGFVRDVRGAPAALYQFATAGCSGMTLWALEPVRGGMACERVSAVGISRDVTTLAFARPQPPAAAYAHSHGLAYGHGGTSGGADSGLTHVSGDWLYGGTRSGDLVVAFVRSRAVAACVNVCTGGVTALALATTYCEGDGGSLLLVGSGDGVVLLCRHTPPPAPSGGAGAAAAGAGSAVAGRRGGAGARSGAGSGAADTFAGWGEVAAGGSAGASSGSGGGGGSIAILATARVGGAVFSISVQAGGPGSSSSASDAAPRSITCLVACADGVLHRLAFAFAYSSAGPGLGPAGGPGGRGGYGSAPAAGGSSSVWRLASQLVERQSHGAAHEGLPAAAPAFVALYPPPVLGPAPLPIAAGSSGGAGGAGGSASSGASAAAGSGASAGAGLAGAPAALQAAARCPDVLCVAFPPGNSEICVTAGSDACIRVWNLSDLACAATATAADAGLPVAVVAGRDGHMSGWQDGAIRCWPLARAHSSAIAASSGSPSAAAAAAAAAAAPLWFIADAHPAREGGVTALALARSERMLLSGGASGAIRLWDARTRGLLATFKEHASVIGQLAILQGAGAGAAPDRLAVSASKDKILSTWDLATMRRLTVSLASASLTAVAVLPPSLPVAAFASSPAGRGAVSADDDTAPAFLTCSVARLLEVWDARRREPLLSIPYPSGRGSGAAATSPAGGHSPSLDVDPQATCIAIPHERHDIFATGGTDGRLLFWSLPSFRVLSSHEVTAGAVRDVAFAPDDRQLIATSSDGGIHVYNVF